MTCNYAFGGGVKRYSCHCCWSPHVCLGEVVRRKPLDTILNHSVHTPEAVAVLVIVVNREVFAYVEVQTQSSNV